MSKHATQPIAASAEDLAWKEGRWVGDRDGETIEEQWSAPAASSLMAMFRWLRDGKVVFFELMTIEAEGSGLVLRIKHFHPGLRGWEDKDESVTLDLVDLADGQAVWFRRGGKESQWLTYRRSADVLEAWFEKSGDAADDIKPFRYLLS